MSMHIKRKICVSMVFILAGSIICLIGVNRLVAPNIEAISRLKAEGMINQLVTEAIYDTFQTEEDPASFFLMTYNKNGMVQMVQANTMLLNQKMAKLALDLQKSYTHMKPQRLYIPFGAVLGTTLLSRGGKGMNVEILPLSVSAYSFETAFESQGINQTKYKIYIHINSHVQMIQPFSKKTFSVATKVLALETIIVGDVPESYVHVPKEDILDVT